MDAEQINTSMKQPTLSGYDGYALTWSLPLLVWQSLFFIGAAHFYGDHYVFSRKELQNDRSVRDDQLDQNVEPKLFLGFLFPDFRTGNRVNRYGHHRRISSILRACFQDFGKHSKVGDLLSDHSIFYELPGSNIFLACDLG